MATLRGPMLSLRASGGLGETLTYAESLGRPYVKAWRRPRNPQSDKQRAIRSVHGYCLGRWAGMSTAWQDTFQPQADARRILPVNFFCGYNVSRARGFRGVSGVWPATEALSTGWISAVGATAGVRDIEVKAYYSSANQAWALHIFRSLVGGFTPAWSNLHQLIAFQGGGWNYWTDEPLAPGTYYYRFGSSAEDGTFQTFAPQASAVIA